MGESTSVKTARRALRRPGRLPFIGFTLFAGLLYLQFLYLPSRLFEPSPSQLRLSDHRVKLLEQGLRKCAANELLPIQYEVPPSPLRANPRWNSRSGQSSPILIANATLFDGTSFVKEPVNILFSHGVITALKPATEGIHGLPEDVSTFDAAGRYVTPGLVDMHSHHISSVWPNLIATGDTNEINDDTGPLTPMVRVLDSMKAYDPAATLIASGGVTSSLILPGSANIMGGEAYPVKNVLRSGPNGEEVVEELLLEHGIHQSERRRYMKMACGENPSRVYDHTRMGNAWKFRKQMAKGKELMAKQDAWCLSASAAKEAGDMTAISQLVAFSTADKGGYPEEFALDSTVAMLRGQVNVNVHCYEQQDFEDMLRHNEEFDFSIAAFHHAIEAWKVPEFIKSRGHNITIATFQDFAFYKHEAYDANLYAGKILAEHQVPVAYKSDHGEEDTNAKYLLFQAAGAHSFGLPADLAMQAVTSVPAKSIQQDHRIGFLKPGYDADIVVWDAHPLSIGATPASVFIDGKSALPVPEDKEVPATVINSNKTRGQVLPQIRPLIDQAERERFCDKLRSTPTRLVFTGIKKSFIGLQTSSSRISTDGVDHNMTMILESGKIVCLGSSEDCVHDSAMDTVLALDDCYILPGLTAVTTDLGLVEILAEDSTGDGLSIGSKDVFDPSSVIYAKYGVHLEGKGFQRARIGGITRAVTPPLSYGSLVRGVSTGIKTTGSKTLLNGGIFQDDVALHFLVGQDSKGLSSKLTISGEVATLRKILVENEGKDSVYGKAANGTIPVVVHAVNKYDIMQLIKLKKDHGKVNLVVMGGHEAPAVAAELAEAGVPLIFTAHRGAPDQWEKKDILPGPPLTRSSASVLVENNVTFAIAIGGGGIPIGSSFIHNLLHEASWVAKYAGLSEEQTIELVSTNVEDILGLKHSLDIVFYEGDPLEFGARVMFVLDDLGNVEECWPEAT